jgi:hypothetical protein
MAGVLGVIWGRSEAECFCGPDWTGQITLKFLLKIDFARIGHFVHPGNGPRLSQAQR